LVTATRIFTDAPLDALRRDPSALGHGEVWRSLTPVLVQSDEGVIGIILVFAVCAVIGIYAECFLSPARWLILYLVGVLSGHTIGEAFQPLAGGTSVAFVGILGGLGAYALLGADRRITRWWRQAALAIPLAVLDTALGDIHGIPYLLGMATGCAWVLSEAPSGRVSAFCAPRCRRAVASRSGDLVIEGPSRGVSQGELAGRLGSRGPAAP
jgi:hypothetical protein